MAYTIEQLTALESAIAQGVVEVQYADKRIKYRTLDEMMQLANTMRAAISPSSAAGRGGRRFASFDKGLS